MDDKLRQALEYLREDTELGPTAKLLLENPTGMNIMPGFAQVLTRLHSTELANKELRRQSVIDPLTELGNRRKYEADLARRMSESSRIGTPFTVIASDLDHFKEVNDGYGHDVGDEVLRRYAGIKALGQRTYDLAYKIGGEEFMLILPGASVETGTKVAERIRQKTSELDVKASVKKDLERYVSKLRDREEQNAYDRLSVVYDTLAVKPDLNLTVSLGVGDFPSRDLYDSMASFTHALDRALYHSKENGRNRVTSVYDIIGELK